MTTTILIRLIASLGLCLGLALLYLRWRDPRCASRWALGGWALVMAGLAGWAASGQGDVALSDAAVLVMVLALAAIAGHAVTLPATAKTMRDRKSDNDNLALGRGYWGRVAARLLGCFVVAPTAGLAAGALIRAWAPGDEASRLMLMATIALLVTAVAWVLQLMSPRPWRMLGLVTVTAAIAAGLVELSL